jgi:sRNA-binding protein
MILRLPNGYSYLVHPIPMHRRKPHSKRAFARPTDWIVQAGSVIAWGRTRRDAIAKSQGRSCSGAAAMKIDAQAIITLLCEKFPSCFVMYEQRRRPIARGIHKEVLLAMPTLTAEQISAAMRLYTGNEGYCRACRAGAARINLMGHEVGCVTAAEADNAIARIEGIREWRKKQKAAMKAAAKEAEAAVKAAEIEAAKPAPVPKGVNASRPTLHT